MAAIQNYATPGEAAVLAVLAGNDMLISSDLPTQYQAVLEATQSQQIPQTLLDQSVTRILVWKLQLGLLGSQ